MTGAWPALALVHPTTETGARRAPFPKAPHTGVLPEAHPQPPCRGVRARTGELLTRRDLFVMILAVTNGVTKVCRQKCGRGL